MNNTNKSFKSVLTRRRILYSKLDSFIKSMNDTEIFVQVADFTSKLNDTIDDPNQFIATVLNSKISDQRNTFQNLISVLKKFFLKQEQKKNEIKDKSIQDLVHENSALKTKVETLESLDKERSTILKQYEEEKIRIYALMEDAKKRFIMMQDLWRKDREELTFQKKRVEELLEENQNVRKLIDIGKDIKEMEISSNDKVLPNSNDVEKNKKIITKEDFIRTSSRIENKMKRVRDEMDRLELEKKKLTEKNQRLEKELNELRCVKEKDMGMIERINELDRQIQTLIFEKQNMEKLIDSVVDTGRKVKRVKLFGKNVYQLVK